MSLVALLSRSQEISSKMIIFLSNLIKFHSFPSFDLSVMETEIFSEGTKNLFVKLTDVWLKMAPHKNAITKSDV